MESTLLKKQLEQKNRLEKKLRQEQDRLHKMQIEVKLLKAYAAKKPKFHHFLKLKTEIEILKMECEKLTNAVDFYSKNHNSLAFCEAGNESYHNTYEEKRWQREKNWNCQLCTFRNHPLLNVCEECEMPRILLGGIDVPMQTSISANNGTPNHLVINISINILRDPF